MGEYYYMGERGRARISGGRSFKIISRTHSCYVCSQSHRRSSECVLGAHACESASLDHARDRILRSDGEAGRARAWSQDHMVR